MSEPEEPAIDYELLLQNTLAVFFSLSPLRISRFRVKFVPGAPLIVGGFGDVTQAKLRTSAFGKDSIVAVKRLRPEGDRNARIRILAALARELRIWNKLRHPNILPLKGFYFDKSSLKTAWIVTPWLDNGHVRKYLAVTKPDENTRLKLVIDTAQGLQYLHGLSPPVCHGDIKAENTLVDDYGNARLCDFGLATILENIPSGLTTSNKTGCSLRYAAPELILVDSPHTLASDIWAWGCLAMLIATDILPYSNKKQDHSISEAIRNREPPFDVSTAPTLELVRNMVSTCWQWEPNSRPDITWYCNTLFERTASDSPASLQRSLSYLVGQLSKLANALDTGPGDPWRLQSRLELAHIACLLELLYVEGNTEITDPEGLVHVATTLIRLAGNYDEELMPYINHVRSLLPKTKVNSPHPIHPQRLEAALKRITRVESSPAGKQRSRVGSLIRTKTTDLTVIHINGSSGLLEGEMAYRLSLPDGIPVALAVCSFLKRQSHISKGAGSSLQVYGYRNASKWVSRLEPSTALKDLYTADPSDPRPCIYVVEQDRPFVIATLVRKQHHSEAGKRMRGVIIVLNDSRLRDALYPVAPDAKCISFEVHSPHLWIPPRTLPLATRLSSLTAFSGDYVIVAMP